MIKGKYRYADHSDINELFGVTPGGHLPDTHMEVMEQGYLVVLMTKEESLKFGYSLHRVFVECKACHNLIPSGRMIQHEKKCWNKHGYQWVNMGFGKPVSLEQMYFEHVDQCGFCTDAHAGCETGEKLIDAIGEEMAKAGQI